MLALTCVLPVKSPDARDSTRGLATTRRKRSVNAVVLYKLVRAPIMLALAVWLTVAPSTVYRSLESLAHELSEGGATWARAGSWIDAHLTSGWMVKGAVLAWLDGLTTALEGFLLMTGRSWATWIVIAGLALLIPIELVSLDHRPGIGKVLVLALDAVIVLYLVRTRLHAK